MLKQVLPAGFSLALIAVLSGSCAHSELVQSGPAPLAEAAAADAPALGVLELQDELASGRTSSEALVTQYLARIDTIDRAGPKLNAVLALNPDALEQARALDLERAEKGSRGPLHGIPILLKDNIESRDPLPTTAGSLALENNLTGRDAPVVARLREAGAIILGKTNLSEWANIRSTGSTSGWSAMGGLTKNPYVLDRSACGSSAGSGVAVAANLAAAALGTETDGSVVCPSALNGVVGLKPTVGLVSRTHIVPISHSQDTAGPMTRSVADAAIMLSVMAGSDPADPATAEADKRRRDYTKALDPEALKGKRVGVMRFLTGYHAATDAVFDKALSELEAAGAVLVDISEGPDSAAIEGKELNVLLTELKAGLNAYLATTPEAVKARTLEALIAFNLDHKREEMPFFAQELFVMAQATKGLDDAEYVKGRDDNLRLAGPKGIDAMLKKHKVDVLVAPTMHPAWTIDLVIGDHFLGAASTLAAVAGYPHLTVPMGFVYGLPVGLSFVGPAYSEYELLALGYAYEQRSKARKGPKMLESLFGVPEAAEHMRHP